MISSIIIPTYNKALWLELVLISLRRCDNIDKCEIIVVNDGGTDNTIEVVESFGKVLNIRCLTQNNLGAAKARNLGALNANGDILIFLDDDRIVNKEFINLHLSIHGKNKNIIVIGKRYQLYLSNLYTKKQYIITDIITGKIENSKLLRLDDYEKVTDLLFDENGITNSNIAWIACIFANASINKNDFLQSGMFDENFFGWGCEDIELGYRLLNNGIRIILDRQIESYHLEHPRNASIPQEYLKNYEYMKKKHGDKSIDLYGAFADGKLSLEKYDSLITEKVKIEKINSEHYCKNKNIFREKGMIKTK